MFAVALLPSVLWPPKPVPPKPVAPVLTDTTPAPTAATPAQSAPAAAAATTGTSAAPPVAPAETVWVTTPLYRLGFSTRGGQLVQAELYGYQSFAPGDSARRVQLIPAGRPLLVHRLVVGNDTVSLADWTFTPSSRAVQVRGLSTPLTFTATVRGVRVSLAYTFTPSEYRFQVRGQVTGLGPQGAVLVIGLGDGLRSVEADASDDARHYSV